MVVLLVSLARRAYHFQQLASSSTRSHECRTYYLKSGVNDEQARTLLAGIGFRKNKVFQLASQLSGGEKMKLAMLIASQQHNNLLLLLDEPDNHLDIESKIILAEALKQYKGGFILVSHDRDFVREAGVNRSYSISL